MIILAMESIVEEWLVKPGTLASQVDVEVGKMALRPKASFSKLLCESIPFNVRTENIIILEQILRERKYFRGQLNKTK